MAIKMKVDPAKLQEIAKKVIGEVRQKVASSGGLSGWTGVKKCVPWVVRSVEKAGIAAGLVGEDKKAIAVQAVLDLVPDRWAPDWILEPFVSWVIDRAVVSIEADAAKG